MPWLDLRCGETRSWPSVHNIKFTLESSFCWKSTEREQSRTSSRISKLWEGGWLWGEIPLTRFQESFHPHVQVRRRISFCKRKEMNTQKYVFHQIANGFYNLRGDFKIFHLINVGKSPSIFLWFVVVFTSTPRNSHVPCSIEQWQVPLAWWCAREPKRGARDQTPHIRWQGPGSCYSHSPIPHWCCRRSSQGVPWSAYLWMPQTS